METVTGMSLKKIIMAGTLAALATSILLGGRNGQLRPQHIMAIPASNNTRPADRSGSANQPRKLPTAHLTNAVRLTENVISGALPEDAAAFAELQSLGVKTIISVDGLQPNVTLAEKFGLRYVHLPHGYDGVPEVRGHELAKAVRDLPGPIYIHCHHGQHRSPAAAAVACVEAGTLDPSQALSVLQLAGTGKNYQGLFRSVSMARRQDDRQLDQLQVTFSATSEIPPLAEAMVEIDALHDRLKANRLSATASDIADALLLKEQFVELQRLAEVRHQPTAYRDLLHDAERAADELQATLADLPATETSAANLQSTESRGVAWQAALARVNQSCTTCHRQYRDNPPHELPLTAAR